MRINRPITPINDVRIESSKSTEQKYLEIKYKMIFSSHSAYNCVT